MSNLMIAMAAASDAQAENAQIATTFVGQMLNSVLWIGTLTLVLGIAMCLVRIVRGPHHAERVLAADTLSLQVVGLVVLQTIYLQRDLYFDAVLAVAILGFASTVAFSQYIGARAKEKMGRQKEAGQ